MFKNNLLFALRTSGMSQADLARKVHVSTSAITSYIQGRRMPTLRIFLRIVKVLHTTPNFLLGYDFETRNIHISVPKIVGILKEKYRQLTMTEKEEIMAALIGHELYRPAKHRI